MKNRITKFALPLLTIILFCFSFFINTGHAEESGKKLRPEEIRENIFDSVMLSEALYLIVGDRGKIYRSMDKGQHWADVPSGTGELLFLVSFPDSHNGWIAGSSGLIIHSRDGGKSWSMQASGTEKHLFGIHLPDALHGFAVGD